MPSSKLLWMIPLALALGAAPASSDELPPVSAAPLGSHMLAQVDAQQLEQDWLAYQLGHFHLQKRHGFAYTREIESGERGMRFSVQGPVVNRKQKTVGLGIELRF